jgi:hypothetical protein
MSDIELFQHGEEGTHGCRNKRLKEEGSEARCCECVPHEGCEELETNQTYDQHH